MGNIYCEICKKFHNSKKTHTQIEKNVLSKNRDKMLEVIKQIIYYKIREIEMEQRNDNVMEYNDDIDKL